MRQLPYKSLKATVLTLGLLSASACTSPFTTRLNDIRVTSVTDVDFKDQSELEWINVKPRPSMTIYRIDFTTSTDLLALARTKDYNVAFAVGTCTKDNVKDNGTGLGDVFWRHAKIYSQSKDIPGYSETIAKGPPFSYHVYVKQIQSHFLPLCLMLSGGSMFGSTLRSNIAVISTNP